MKTSMALVALAVVVCAGCNPSDASDIKRDAGNLAKSTGETLSNAQLAARVNAALVNTKDVKMDGLHIEAKDGTVTLSGHVHNAAEKELVNRVANSVKGVEMVVDKLRIE